MRSLYRFPIGCRKQKEEGEKSFPIPKAAVILCVITLIAGVCLSGVHEMTADTIAEQRLAASAASYQEVCPEAETFEHDDTLSAAVEALGRRSLWYFLWKCIY